MRAVVRYFFVGIASVLASASVQSEDKPDITVAFSYAAPLIYSKDGQIVGLYPDVLREVFEKKLGFQLRFADRPWKRAQADVERGDADIIVTVPTPERRQYVLVTEQPIYRLERNIYSRVGHPLLSSLKTAQSLEDLLALDLTASTDIGDGWYRANVAVRGVQTHYTPDLINSFMMVADGRADVVISSSTMARSIIDEKELGGRILDTGGRLDSPPAHILIGKKSHLSSQMDIVNDAIAALIASGQLEILSRQHLQ